MKLGVRPGARFTLGYSPFPDLASGVEATYLFLSEKTSDFNAASASGNPILARPFFNVEKSFRFPAGGFPQFGDQLASQRRPQQRTTVVRTALARRDFSSNTAAAWNSCSATGTAVSPRHWHRPTVHGRPASQVFEEGTIVGASDLFDASNEFHGFELDSPPDQWRRWSLEAVAKVALGGMRSRVMISGETITTTPGEPAVTTEGALLALPTTSAATPRAALPRYPKWHHPQYALTCRLKATFGYSLLYLSSRPAGRPDRRRPGRRIDECERQSEPTLGRRPDRCPVAPPIFTTVFGRRALLGLTPVLTTACLQPMPARRRRRQGCVAVAALPVFRPRRSACAEVSVPSVAGDVDSVTCTVAGDRSLPVTPLAASMVTV